MKVRHRLPLPKRANGGVCWGPLGAQSCFKIHWDPCGFVIVIACKCPVLSVWRQAANCNFGVRPVDIVHVTSDMLHAWHSKTVCSCL